MTASVLTAGDQMQHDEGHFQGAGSMQLYYQRWRPDTTPARAVIIMVHGDFAHSGWYVNLPNYEAPRGYAVYAYDRRGWGRSPGQRGYIRAWSENLGDLDAFVQFVRTEEPDLPVFLMGHTGGTVIVLDYAQQHPGPVRGVFCVSTVLDTSAAVPAPLRALLHLLAGIAPRLTINARRRVDAGIEWVSHDQTFVKFARSDPLSNAKVTPRWLVESEKAMKRVSAQATGFKTPLLLLVGEDDRAALPAITTAYFERAGSSDKQLREYPDAYTNLLSDTVSERVLQDIDTWLEEHV
jgi:alpha-beta hydrolase superfamily lysophospholipase